MALPWVIQAACFPRRDRQISPCTASSFLLACPRRKEPKKKGTRHPALHCAALRYGSPRSGTAPGARHEGTSLSLRASLGVHASRPPPQRLRSAFCTGLGSGLRVERNAYKVRRLQICLCSLCRAYQAAPSAPFRRPSGVVAQGVEPHGCGERPAGHGWPCRPGPWSQRRREGTRSAAQGRMKGQAVLVTFVATDKSDSPCKAKSVARAEERAALTHKA